ncbi:hypothetical protein CRENBAI_013373 [Crenichthys baileyi]|uniref:Uncharacterized protein n=1 Tax=Crenichthys baileyi TaxID=28760 RepID=A0AAV9QYB1_9TELE
MTEEQRHVDQVREWSNGFRAGEELIQHCSHILFPRSLPWERLKVANLMLDWLEVWGGCFSHYPLTPGMVARERERAVAEIGPLFDLIPGGPDAVDRLPPFLVPFPAPEELVIEPLPLRVPVCAPARVEFESEFPPLRVSVPAPAPVEFEIHVPVSEGAEDGLPSFLELLGLPRWPSDWDLRRSFDQPSRPPGHRSLRRRLQDELLREYVRHFHRPPEQLLISRCRAPGWRVISILYPVSVLFASFLDPVSTIVAGLPVLIKVLRSPA